MTPDSFQSNQVRVKSLLEAGTVIISPKCRPIIDSLILSDGLLDWNFPERYRVDAPMIQQHLTRSGTAKLTPKTSAPQPILSDPLDLSDGAPPSASPSPKDQPGALSDPQELSDWLAISKCLIIPRELPRRNH